MTTADNARLPCAAVDGRNKQRLRLIGTSPKSTSRTTQCTEGSMSSLMLTGKRRCALTRSTDMKQSSWLCQKFESKEMGGMSPRDSTGIIPGNHRGCSREAVPVHLKRDCLVIAHSPFICCCYVDST